MPVVWSLWLHLIFLLALDCHSWLPWLPIVFLLFDCIFVSWPPWLLMIFLLLCHGSWPPWLLMTFRLSSFFGSASSCYVSWPPWLLMTFWLLGLGIRLYLGVKRSGWLVHTLSNPFLKAFVVSASTTSAGSPFQASMTLIVKKFFLMSVLALIFANL